jgi:hypothetical protein
MTFPFAWNEFADQPHNVAPRRERLSRHFKHAGSYLSLAARDLILAIPVLRRYRRYLRDMYTQPVEIGARFAVSSSPAGERNEEVAAALLETGARQTLVRVPSWERNNLRRYEAFIGLLRRHGFAVTAALLQRRQDVLDPVSWEEFLGEAFTALGSLCSHFEIGHAWNRTKWGVWDHREYIDLAGAAASLAAQKRLKIVGPAVIDFEFHLYPPTLRAVPFDVVSSLLYVDRTGAPEDSQFGWTTAMKVALWRAVVDSSLPERRQCWITEFNWPLLGAGKYSPAPGKPSVNEEQQADYLVRYYVICLASGLVDRVFWWQLVAPGYGLIDSRERPWRRRPSFLAFRTMTRLLEGSRFEGKAVSPAAEIYLFRAGNGDEFAVCWTRAGAVEHLFSRPPRLIIGRDGEESESGSAKITIQEKPQYVLFG